MFQISDKIFLQLPTSVSFLQLAKLPRQTVSCISKSTLVPSESLNFGEPLTTVKMHEVPKPTPSSKRLIPDRTGCLTSGRTYFSFALGIPNSPLVVIPFTVAEGLDKVERELRLWNFLAEMTVCTREVLRFGSVEKNELKLMKFKGRKWLSAFKIDKMREREGRSSTKGHMGPLEHRHGIRINDVGRLG